MGGRVGKKTLYEYTIHSGEEGLHDRDKAGTKRETTEKEEREDAPTRG